MNENDKLKEKLDLLSALKEDEENEKKKKKDPKKEKIIKEIKKVKETTPKKHNHVLIGVSFFTLVMSLTYLIYNIVKATDQVNQPFLIINSCCLLVLSTLFVIIGFTTNKNTKQNLTTFSIFSLFSYTLFQFLVSSNLVTIPTLKTVGDFSNMSINEVIKWASENHIELEQTYEYSDNISSDHIITQDIPAETLLKKVKKIEVIVSNGPNYESIVNIPNMIGWNVDDVVKKIKDEKLSNVTIEFNFNETISKDIEYEQSKSGEMRRNEALVLKFSLGLEADLKPVTLEDLIEKEEFDAILWLKRNGIRYEISYEFHNDIETGKVISTDPVAGTLIDQKVTTVKLVLSKGPKIIAPNLMEMSLDEITEWAIKNKLTLVYDSEYHDQIKAGDLIRVSVKEGEVLEVNQKIYIITSKGSLKMISYSDGDIESLRKFAIENKLTLTESEEFSDTVEKGKFISISKKAGETVNSGEEISVKISLGKSTEIPNFIGMNVSKAKTTCNNLGITCTFSYVYSSKTKDIIFNQSMSSGSKVISGTTVVLTVSNGPKPATNKPSNSTTNTPSNSGNTTPTTPVTPVCEEKFLGNLIIQESWLMPGNSSKTVATLRTQLSAKYPNVTFNIVTRDHNTLNSGLIHPSSPTNSGTPIYACRTYTIYVVE